MTPTTDLSAVTWGLAKLGRAPPPVLDEVSVALADRVGDMGPVDIAQVAYAFSRSNVPATRLLNRMAKAASRHAEGCSLQSPPRLRTRAPPFLADLSEPSPLPSSGRSYSRCRASESRRRRSTSAQVGQGAPRALLQPHRIPRVSVCSLVCAAEHLAGRAATLDTRLISNLACAFAKGRRLDALQVPGDAPSSPTRLCIHFLSAAAYPRPRRLTLMTGSPTPSHHPNCRGRRLHHRTPQPLPEP